MAERSHRRRLGEGCRYEQLPLYMKSQLRPVIEIEGSQCKNSARDAIEPSTQSALKGQDTKLEEDEASPYAASCRDNAKIWSRYLRETDNEDKEVTSIGNSSLDSMLTFVSIQRFSELNPLLIVTRLVCSRAYWPRSS
jgi:hypothetical protein